MGHANLSNLSDLFINLLYAKGKLTIATAIETAVRRNETLHASEGQYHDEEMLGIGFMDIINLLNSSDGQGFDNRRNWEGPWVVPDWDVCKPPKGVTPTDTMRNLLKQCRKVDVAYIPMCPVWEQRELFGVCADAIQDEGHDDWAELVRDFPKCFRAYAMWKMDDEEYYNGDAWEDFDKIRWVFASGWRKRYRDVPRLSHVTH